MKAFVGVCIVFVFISVTQANVISDPNISLSEQQQNELSDLLTILLAVYDNDFTQIPSDPNEILALETSEDSRDQLAWEIIKIIQSVVDSNSISFDENTLGEMDMQDRSAIMSENYSSPNVDSLSGETNDTNGQAGLSIQEQAIGFAQSMESIEELSNPLGSCILQSKTYRITTLPLAIEGHVVIPAGTKLIAPFDPNAVIIEVMPGGLLDMGKAVNYSDSNFPDILPRVEIVPENSSIYFNYNCIGIYVHRGANPATRICNTTVMSCQVGLVIDEQLTSPMQSVITYGCYDGIYLFAPNAITDSEFGYYGYYAEQVFDYVGAGIYVCLDSVQYPNPAASISRTVTYDGDIGIYLEGAYSDPNLPDPNQVNANLEVINSCSVLSYCCGIYKTEDAATIDVTYCAFGGNEYDVSFDAPLTGCIGLGENPFYIIGQEKKLYVVPWSKMIDAGYGMAEDGMGTCPDWPDIGQMDIGCHFPVGVTGSFGIPSSQADFNWDGIVNEIDLELMNRCMGATADPNIVMMDTNYDSQVNMPDFGIFSFDYGYSNDANLPGSHDPNCERSDFNGDHRVDLEDVGILADYWLTMVFDEYRICSLCNLDTVAEPNEPAADTIIDSRDYDAFMAEWGKVSYSGCSISFKKEPNDPVEPNSLSDEIIIRADNYPSITTWLFLQVDGSPAGLTYLDYTEEPVFTVPTYEFSNGYHTITIGGYTSEGGCWMENTRVQFRNNLYLASIPEMYEPNEPYEIRGFFDSGTVQISTDPNYSVSSDSDYIHYCTTPITAISAATIQYQNGEESQTKTVALMAAVDMSKVDPNSYRALIVAPNRDVNRAIEDEYFTNNRLLTAIRETLEAANIPYIELIRKNANWDNIKSALTGPNLNYVYWISHMNSHVGVGEDAVQRTAFMCWDNRNYWFDKESCVLSWVKSDDSTGTIPTLPGDWDTRGHSMYSLGLWRTKTIKEFWAIGCLGAEFNDMARAIGAYNYKDSNGHYTHIYIGNRIEVMPGGARNLLFGYPSAISKIIRRHRTAHLGDALLTNDLTVNELKTLWGDDHNKDGTADNTLQWWPADIELWRVIFQ